MTEDSASLPARISALYKQLAASADVLNSASDELANGIAPLEGALQRLNIGIECWTPIAELKRNDSGVITRHVGYAKLNGVWRVALRESLDYPNSVNGSLGALAGLYQKKDEMWPFNEAPRHLRLDAIEHLPTLLERLVKKSEAVAKRIAERTAAARSLAAAIQQASAEIPPKPKKDALPITPRKTSGETR
jgi:hypothetical protein